MKPTGTAAPASAVKLRRLLLATFLLGSTGVGAELWLMEHTEGVWQLVPLVLVGCALLGLVWVCRSPGRLSRGIFRALMALVILSGPVGAWLHFKGKAEFKREIDPSLGGWELVWTCLRGHSLPPVLAPGGMVVLGMLGLAYAGVAHPAVRPGSPVGVDEL
jgi:hypothetical protein